MVSRRNFIKAPVAMGMMIVNPRAPAQDTHSSPAIFLLRAGIGQSQIVPEQYGKTAVWYFNNRLPGPEIRIKQGDWVKILVQNNLPESTTVHWHGLRVSNDMDGVPHLTQPPIETGQSHLYQFQAIDAGTFWYHPHQRSFEQVGRGLSGPLIIEESSPIVVDRDITWMLDDWQLLPSAQISEGFGSNMHDLSHEGRIGNTVTINGKIPESLSIQTGERIRLRLVNAANARIFALQFDEHAPYIIAIDGQPVAPHIPADNRYILAPGMRTDLIVDCIGLPGEKFQVTDSYYPGGVYHVIDLDYTGPVLREQLMDSAIALPSNPVAEPDLQNATEFRVTLVGGARGNMAGATFRGQWQDIRSLVHHKKAWAINGVVADGHVMDPLITLARNQTGIFDIKNDTAWPHPMHLHGHAFRVLSRNGQTTPYQPWQDTVLIDQNESVRIAFVADNPGDWMFHCHILEHQAAGMMGVVRVSE